MSSILISPVSQKAIDRFIANPSHALLLIAPTGSGKGTISRYIASNLLGVDETKLNTHPYLKFVHSDNGKTISINEIREIIHFVSLRVADAKARRVVVIEDSQHMTRNAQNALLKTLEEPPEGTTIILTMTNEAALLPTIHSRSQKIRLQPPDAVTVQTYFRSKGYTPKAVDTALLMTGGMPGLMSALLAEDTSHTLMTATTVARDILQKTTFERIAFSESLAQQPQLWLDVLFILAQMAQVAIVRSSSNSASVKRWEKILETVYEARVQMQLNAQPKLVAFNFMLAI